MSEQVITKRCSKCKIEKPLSEFTKWYRGKLGCHNQCKICKSAWSKTTKAKTRYQQYHNTEHGREVGRRSSRRYGHSPKGLATQKRRREKDVEQCAARSAISNAIKLGNILEASEYTCHECPNQAEQWHHWLGYEPEHWFDVIPVCKKCHCGIHKAMASSSESQ